MKYSDITEKLKNGSLYLFTVVSGIYSGEKCLLQNGKLYNDNKELTDFWEELSAGFDNNSCPAVIKFDSNEIFTERMVNEPYVVICGGGHVSAALASLLDYMEYRYTIIDDREEFANKKRFPNASQCICDSFKNALVNNSFPADAYYVIVTRGHMADLECLEYIIDRPYGYLGMIGSRSKVKKTMETLSEKGISDLKLQSIHAPIGLSIGGETPNEIAVSIMAQLIQIRNLPGKYTCLDEGLKQVLINKERTKDSCVLAVIIGKRGSAPRGVGSRMLISKSGIEAGTIGGGTIEYEAANNAISMLSDCSNNKNVYSMETYRLNMESAASLGMWCNGEVDVFFELLNGKIRGNM